MKKVLLMILLGCTISVNAQFAPNTRWPYLYENFSQGTIYFAKNQKSEAQLNVHLLGNTLHYITQDGKIFEGSDKDVIRVEIGNDTYWFANHKLMQVITQEGDCALLKLVYGDFDSMTSGSGAYGSSLNSSASRDLSSLDLGGLNQPELGKMLQERNDGSEIPLETAYYFILGGKVVEANKKAVTETVEVSQSDNWKKFLKENKIKWKKEDSLISVLGFFAKE
ncbi:MAG: hypothetical protein J6D17_06215 [Bacteroides sp.]|nr:hypothetical protein [Bacteroides sp.]MBP3505268.1 hypothetical protein [Lachnospiraceae bacterium]